MSKLAKSLISFFVLLIVAGGGFFYYMMVPTAYYTQITDKGTEIKGTFDNKEEYVQYEYSQAGYDKKGNEKTLEFMTHPDLGRPFKQDAYLKINVTRFKGENSYEEVQKSEISQQALEKLAEK